MKHYQCLCIVTGYSKEIIINKSITILCFYVCVETKPAYLEGKNEFNYVCI